MRSTAILTLIVLACACGNGEPGGGKDGPEAGMPVAVSADGALTLRIVHLGQVPSFVGPEMRDLALEAELVDPADSVFLIEHPPVKSALTPDGEELAPQGYIPVIQPRDRRLSIHRWTVGPERNRIETLEIALMVLRVTKWSERVYEGLGQGESEALPLGLFEARVAGEGDRITVTLREEAGFDEDHAAHKKKLPPILHPPTFSLGLLTLTDAEGRPLDLGGEGGAFAIFGRHGKDGEPGKIAWPVTLRSRMPDEFETKEEVFVFTGLNLPPAAKPK